MKLDEVSVAAWRAADPRADAYVRRSDAREYLEFVELLYDDIVQVVQKIEENKSVRQNDNEDRITLDICNMLEQTGHYSAKHDGFQSGHVDILVKHSKFDHSWIGEAKFFTSHSAVLEGFKQLTDRYATAQPAYKAGLLIYIKTGKAADKMNSWEKKLLLAGYAGLKSTACSRRSGLHFYSTHTHSSTGLPFEVWHVGVVLHFAPSDKSAKTAAAKAKQKAAAAGN